MELNTSTFISTEDIDENITETGIYYASISFYVIREKMVEGYKSKVKVFSFSGKYVFSKHDKERSFKKVFEDSGISTELNRKTSNKPEFKKEIKVIKYLGEVSKQALNQDSNKEWQKKENIKENTKTILTTLPLTTNSASTSLHRSMSIDDL